MDRERERVEDRRNLRDEWADLAEARQTRKSLARKKLYLAWHKFYVEINPFREGGGEEAFSPSHEHMEAWINTEPDFGKSTDREAKIPQEWDFEWRTSVSLCQKNFLSVSFFAFIPWEICRLWGFNKSVEKWSPALSSIILFWLFGRTPLWEGIFLHFIFPSSLFHGWLSRASEKWGQRHPEIGDSMRASEQGRLTERLSRKQIAARFVWLCDLQDLHQSWKKWESTAVIFYRILCFLGLNLKSKFLEAESLGFRGKRANFQFAISFFLPRNGTKSLKFEIENRQTATAAVIPCLGCIKVFFLFPTGGEKVENDAATLFVLLWRKLLSRFWFLSNSDFLSSRISKEKDNRGGNGKGLWVAAVFVKEFAHFQGKFLFHLALHTASKVRKWPLFFSAFFFCHFESEVGIWFRTHDYRPGLTKIGKI